MSDIEQIKDFTAESPRKARESPRFFTFRQRSSAKTPRLGGGTLQSAVWIYQEKKYEVI